MATKRFSSIPYRLLTPRDPLLCQSIRIVNPIWNLFSLQRQVPSPVKLTSTLWRNIVLCGNLSLSFSHSSFSLSLSLSSLIPLFLSLSLSHSLLSRSLQHPRSISLFLADSFPRSRSLSSLFSLTHYSRWYIQEGTQCFQAFLNDWLPNSNKGLLPPSQRRTFVWLLLQIGIKVFGWEVRWSLPCPPSMICVFQGRVWWSWKECGLLQMFSLNCCKINNSEKSWKTRRTLVRGQTEQRSFLLKYILLGS